MIKQFYKIKIKQRVKHQIMGMVKKKNKKTRKEEKTRKGKRVKKKIMKGKNQTSQGEWAIHQIFKKL